MKMKKIEELENKISDLKKELSEQKNLNEFLSNYIETGQNCPIIFSNRYNIYYGNSTIIEYLYQNKIHTITISYLGDKSKNKIIKNEKNYFIFEDANGSR